MTKNDRIAVMAFGVIHRDLKVCMEIRRFLADYDAQFLRFEHIEPS